MRGLEHSGSVVTSVLSVAVSLPTETVRASAEGAESGRAERVVRMSPLCLITGGGIDGKTRLRFCVLSVGLNQAVILLQGTC